MMNRNLYIVDGDDNSTWIKTVCPLCGKQYTFVVDMNPEEFSKRFDVYMAGGLIQDVFPEFDADTREFIKTGICNDCYPSEDGE